jgi:transposase InsO family protein
MPDVVTLDVLDTDAGELRAQIVRLENRVRMLLAVVRLLFCVFRISGLRLDGDRVPSGEGKTKLLGAIEHARTSLKLTVVLRLIGLSPSRHHAWTKRQKECALDDRSSCPRSSPGQVTATEIRSMHDMATSPEHRHMSVRTLSLHAQRLGRVFVSAGTWLRLIRERGWRRPRTRVHPTSPKQGVRATKPNEYWHIDVTIIKLLDGTKVYLHADIDNLSRRILAWKVALRLEPQNTCAVLVEAGKTLPPEEDPATVVADSGVENVNGAVDALLGLGRLRRVLAQVEVDFSNSMIEAFWRSMKHNWLFLNQLDTPTAVERLVSFYVTEHNSIMPHAAFNGQTPDEVYFGTGDHVAAQLAQRRTDARQARLAANRMVACAQCLSDGPRPESSAIFDVVHLHPQKSQMS